MLTTACAEAATWPDDVKLAVNVSPVQFRSGTLALKIVAALAASGLPASRLELEITEAVLIRDDEAALAILHQLRGIGVRIALDDFGTGYSSLSYLQRFPFDKIKIDRCFVDDIEDPDGSSCIVQAVVNIAAARHITTTAEGVETAAATRIAANARLLRNAGLPVQPGQTCRRHPPDVALSRQNAQRRRGNPETDRGGSWPPRLNPSRSRKLIRNRGFGSRDAGVDGDAAQQVVRSGKRLVVLFVRWNVGLRAGLLGAFGREMAAHRRLSLDIGAALQLVRHILQHLDIGRDALAWIEWPDGVK